MNKTEIKSIYKEHWQTLLVVSAPLLALLALLLPFVFMINMTEGHYIIYGLFALVFIGAIFIWATPMFSRRVLIEAIKKCQEGK